MEQSCNLVEAFNAETCKYLEVTYLGSSRIIMYSSDIIILGDMNDSEFVSVYSFMLKILEVVIMYNK